MSTECAKCSGIIHKDDDSIVCCNCHVCFHFFFCVGYSEASFKILTNNKKKSFKCHICIDSCFTSKTKTYMVSDITSVAKLVELVRSINFMGNWFDDFSKK